ncbi:hypothetical protein BV20DRAFT_849485 [Pilatotrama ljubarskyi]|nr:hypothetical protein BV20DRAFT_849485 [Pilatotrama ljubarskyi]
MSQPKLTLRPPPNVDFVQGYPGIPPGGSNRPQAAVKGAIEVRVGPQGVKAKWVRIELRKIETLPGGGVANTFFDFVGQSPINLWQSPNDEYNTLHTNDFPFFIRIPESIPPTISLEKGAGIKYELIASICVQGKKGFLRRDKPTITATASPIIIDKHELHSTWPIYSQPETRTHSQDGVTLVVERAHTCYGPGDRVVVMATVKSDTVHTVMLRGFEFMLRETTVFRAGPHSQGKKGSPQIKVASIGEQKVPVNATLYGGTQHKAELSVTIPSHHTSATINAARHIDITYVLTVKALMNTGQPVTMDLPVMISNWPRAVSLEAMRRIGHAFNVSLPGQADSQHHSRTQPGQFAPALMGKQSLIAPPPNTSSGRTASSHANSSSIDNKSSVSDLRSPKPAFGQFATSPIADKANKDRFGFADEFGSRKKSFDHDRSSFAAQTIGAINLAANNASSSRGGGGSAASSETNSVPAARPRSSSGRGNPSGRLTLVNLTEDEHKEVEQEIAKRPPSVIMESPTAIATPPDPTPKPTSSTNAGSPAPPKPSTSPLGQRWATAEEEKKRLYELAVANVERVQGRSITTSNASETSLTQPVASGAGSGSSAPVGTPPPSKPTTRWPTAEEEKARLYQQAQAAVARARSFDGSQDASYSNARVVSSVSMAAARSPGMSPGAALFSEAMSAINRPIVPSGAPDPAVTPPPAPVGMASPISPAVASPIASPTPARQSTTPSLLSAADEKAMLARYYEAKNAVYQTQTAHYGRVPGNAEPMPYNALYPASPQAGSPAPSQSYSQPQSQPLSLPTSYAPPGGMPPPFQAVASGSSSQHPILSEKERLRRHFEAQDAAAAMQQQAPPQPQPQWHPPPPQEPYRGSPVPPHAYSQQPPMAPMSPEPAARIQSYAAPPADRPPPFSAPSSQPLSAYEEKEMLRRRYEAQDAAPRNSVPPPTPPPRASQMMNGPRGRPPPTPPMSPNTPGGARPLTAAEEKARLKALYEAEERTQRSPPPVQVPPAGAVQVPYPSPPPSNGYHSAEATERLHKTPSPAPTAVWTTPPPPPPLAPKPPREYIEETRAEDLRTAAKLEAIDRADPANVLASLKAADPDLASLDSEELREDDVDLDSGADIGSGEPGEHTFGPGALSAVVNAAPSRSSTADSGAPSSAGAPSSSPNGFLLSVPPPPPLPPKVPVGSD